MRSARRAASRTLCVTKTTVRPVARKMRSSSSCRRSRVIASSAPNGSSMSRTSASWARARAIATRWRMPPESSCGRLSANPPRCTRSSRSSAFARRSRRATPRSRSASSTLRETVSHGNSAASWNMTALRRPSPRTTWPAVGRSSPATRLSRVVFPQPEAPTRHTNSPAATVRSSRSSASTAPGPWPNRFDAESMRTATDGRVRTSASGRRRSASTVMAFGLPGSRGGVGWSEGEGEAPDQ